MFNENLETLGNRAAQIAMRAAVRAIQARGASLSESQLHSLVTALREGAPAAIKEGLRDAREAISANMPAVAEATFAASMASLGVRCALQVLE